MWVEVDGKGVDVGGRPVGAERPARRGATPGGLQGQGRRRAVKIGVARAVADRGRGTGLRLDRGRRISLRTIPNFITRSKDITSQHYAYYNRWPIG